MRKEMQLEHANITVSNIDNSLEFYSALFHFKERWRGQVPGGNQPTVRALHIGNDNVYLALFEAEKPGRAPIDYATSGINHIGFVVDDIEPYRQRLIDLGVDIHFEPGYKPGKRFYFYDPDGIEIELVAYTHE
ncbi:MAG: catechol 2,3-dioxygenase-like lactoylglutathione lyase family enzyme [Halioglobus sp.]|jgi:glyoxylase I family protein